MVTLWWRELCCDSCCDGDDDISKTKNINNNDNGVLHIHRGPGHQSATVWNEQGRMTSLCMKRNVSIKHGLVVVLDCRDASRISPR